MKVLSITYLFICSAALSAIPTNAVAFYDDRIYGTFSGSSYQERNSGGLYFGARAGGEAVNTPIEIATQTVQGSGITGSVYGGYLGYQLPISSTVSVSLEGEYNQHNTNLKFMRANSLIRRLDLDESYGGNLRLGFEVYEFMDFYIYAGLTRLKTTAKSSFTDPLSLTIKTTDDFTGKLGGLGLELMNNSPMRLRLEYRYTKYYDCKALAINQLQTNRKHNPSSNVITLGAQYNL